MTCCTSPAANICKQSVSACLCGYSGYLFLGRGQRDARLRVQVVSERSDLLSVPAVHSLHRRSPGREGE